MGSTQAPAQDDQGPPIVNGSETKSDTGDVCLHHTEVTANTNGPPKKFEFCHGKIDVKNYCFKFSLNSSPSMEKKSRETPWVDGVLITSLHCALISVSVRGTRFIFRGGMCGIHRYTFFLFLCLYGDP